MAQNVASLLRRWWNEQHKIARESGSIVGAAALSNAESRMVILNLVLSLVDLSATFDSEERTDREKELWDDICAIAELQNEPEAGSWKDIERRTKRAKALAKIINGSRK